MLAMPIFVWLDGQLWRRLLGLIACLACFWIVPQFLFGPCFILGAYAARLKFRLRFLEHALPQWLGHISYPLYLSHWLVLTYLPGPMVGRIAAAFILAQILTVTVERWSIRASRRISRPAHAESGCATV